MNAIVCWLTRNLRLADNLPLAAASRDAGAVIPVFVLDDFYLTDDYSPPRLQLLAGSLRELEESVRGVGGRLVVRKGPADEALSALCREAGASAVYVPRDHEPHPIALQARVEVRLAEAGVRLVRFDDFLAVPTESLRTGGGKPFSVYTPFKRRWLEAEKPRPVPAPRDLATPEGLATIPLDRPRGFRAKGAPENPRSGEREARRLLDRFLGSGASEYADRRDRPDVEGTSRLSPHLRFGTLGIRTVLAECREAWKAAPARARRSIESFVSELAWREFYAHRLFHDPDRARRSDRPELASFPWVSGAEERRRFEAWCAGETGVPLVDAGMRQLLEEGWMHNRVRMVVASFLVKDLLVDWRLGEKYFRERLADGDLASNVGGWQWSAGSGLDAPPFFRILNPAVQARRFDPNGAYVARYAPGAARRAPIVDHAQARLAALEAYRRAR